jgi:NADPH:quinone reductase-like Zn-dependent oxidoreductase
VEALRPHAIQIRQTGGPEVLNWTPIEAGEANRLVRLPDAISFDQAAAMMLQGMTAQAPIRQVYPVKAGDLILVHAAAGGTGLILFLRAAALAATVIGAVSTEAKAERREELEASTNELFNVVAPGNLRINVNQRFALKDAADAHKALEARATSGYTVLIIEPTVHRSFS